MGVCSGISQQNPLTKVCSGVVAPVLILLCAAAVLVVPLNAMSTDIFVAIEKGDCRLVSFLLRLDPKMLEDRSVRGIKPIHRASAMGEINILRVLLDEGADVNSRCFDDTTPLMKASQAGEPDVLKLFDAADLMINARDKRGWTALHYAACCGCEETIQFLIENGAEVNARTKGGCTSLCLAKKNDHADAADRISAYGGIK